MKISRTGIALLALYIVYSIYIIYLATNCEGWACGYIVPAIVIPWNFLFHSGGLMTIILFFILNSVILYGIGYAVGSLARKLFRNA